MGIAIARNGQLIEWRLKIYHKKWSEEKLRKMMDYIEHVLSAHKINQVGLKESSAYVPSDNYRRVLAGIKGILKKNKVEYKSYSINDLKGSLANKRELMNNILLEHIELLPIARKMQKSGHEYYIKLFEAVCCAQQERIIT